MNIKDIKKIDIHAHAKRFPEYAPNFPWLPSTVLTMEQNLEIYDEINIESGVLLPIIDMVGQPQISTNEACIDMARNSGGRFDWFMNVSPYASFNKADDDLTYLFEHYIKLGAKGFGEVTSNIYVDDPKMDNLFSFIAQFKLPCTIHLYRSFDGSYGMVDEIHLPRLEKMLKKYKDLKILGHSTVLWSELSGDVTEDTREKYNDTPVKEGGTLVRFLREYENFCLDLSAGSGANALMRDREFAAKLIEEFPDKIFYGCDICNKVTTFHTTFSDFLEDMVKDGYISFENYVKVVRNNAAKLLGREEYKIEG